MTPQNLKLWTHPKDYIGEVWPCYYSAGVGRSRDSDCLEKSNFECMLTDLGGESETVIIVRENHWAVGWVEWIAIHQDDEAALKIADDINEKLKQHPIIDETHLSELELEEADEIWEKCYGVKQRISYIRSHRDQFEFPNYQAVLDCVRGRCFYGYASELVYR